MKHIVCFHLFNDYSGSPKVLKVVLQRMLDKGYQVDLVTSTSGVLDELQQYPNLRKHTYSYSFSATPIVTMLRYFGVQLLTFFWAFRWLLQKNVVFYINTLLPVAPALAGRLMRKKVVYHYHENATVKGCFYRILATVMQRLAHRIICVSHYQASFLRRKKGIRVVPNALPQSFVDRLIPMPEEAFGRKRILMLGSLKKYKSPLEFIELANLLPQYSFEMVINDTLENIDSFIKEHQLNIGANLIIYPRQNDVVPFYNRASLVLNLSNKDMAIETFGLTALEAMSAALPVIVPTVGGIAEMVENGTNGYQIDVQNMHKIEEMILKIMSDKKLYLHLSNNALKYSAQYREKKMIDDIENILNV